MEIRVFLLYKEQEVSVVKLENYGVIWGYVRVDCSWDFILVLRRGRGPLLPSTPFISPSSGGSDNGLEVAVSGLDGGLSAFVSRPVLSREGISEGSEAPFFRASRAKIDDIAGEFLARSQKCSYGKITRV